MSWNRFKPPAIDTSQWHPDYLEAGDVDTVTTTSTAPRTRNASELSTRIKTAGGMLTVSANDSDYLVAVNNGLRFTVTRLQNGQYQVTESMNNYLLAGAVLLIGVVLLSRR